MTWPLCSSPVWQRYGSCCGCNFKLKGRCWNTEGLDLLLLQLTCAPIWPLCGAAHRQAHANLANALQQLGQLDLALLYYQVRLAPWSVEGVARHLSWSNWRKLLSPMNLPASSSTAVASLCLLCSFTCTVCAAPAPRLHRRAEQHGHCVPAEGAGAAGAGPGGLPTVAGGWAVA